jgi:hypothetical protein
MSVPPDKITIRLDQNDDGDDPRSIAAVEDALRRLAAQNGIEVVKHGEIDPAAKENPARFEKIKQETQPKLIEFSSQQTKLEETEERMLPSGRIDRRTQLITQTTRELAVDLKQLADLARDAGAFVGTVYHGVVQLAVRTCEWAKKLVGSKDKE